MVKKATKKPKITVIVPMYNEEKVIDTFFKRIIPIVSKESKDYEIICINDGSRDKTINLLIKHSKKNSRIKVINFSRNFGKEAALTAGIDASKGDVSIPIDADLQDPPELIPKMIKKWNEGYKVVLATRKKRDGETFLKKLTASLFYKFIGKISDTEIPANTGDYRLMDRQVVEAIKSLPEKSRFMKGIFAWAGFKTTTIYFNRDPRAAGNTSWSFWKLWQFALDGIFGFTSVPLKVWTYIGVVISLLSFIYASYLIYHTYTYGIDVPGYASLMTVVLFLGGIQLISLGVIGEYISRIYNETKGRPIYIISEKYNFDD